MAGTDDKFNPPKLTLPPDFLRQLNLSPDFVQRLNTLVSPEAKQRLEQFAQRLRQQHPLLKPRIYEMIRLALQKRGERAAIEEELRRVETWLDSEVDRRLWDSAPTASPLPSTAPPSSPPTAAPVPVQPEPSPEEPQPEVPGPPPTTAKAWVPYAIKQWPQKKGENQPDYVDRLLRHAPKRWAKHTIQNLLSAEKK